MMMQSSIGDTKHPSSRIPSDQETAAIHKRHGKDLIDDCFDVAKGPVCSDDRDFKIASPIYSSHRLSLRIPSGFPEP